MKVTVLADRIEIKSDGGEDEVMQIKTLPLRQWDNERGVWVVPYSLGMFKTFENVFGLGSVSRAIQVGQEAYENSLKPRPFTLTEAYQTPANIAIHKAYVAHAYKKGEHTK